MFKKPSVKCQSVKILLKPCPLETVIGTAYLHLPASLELCSHFVPRSWNMFCGRQVLMCL